MPRYIFRVHDDRGRHLDEHVDLPDLRAAKLYALRYAGQHLADDPECAITGQWSVSVTKDGNGSVYEVTVLAMTVPQDSLN